MWLNLWSLLILTVACSSHASNRKLKTNEANAALRVPEEILWTKIQERAKAVELSQNGLCLPSQCHTWQVTVLACQQAEVIDLRHLARCILTLPSIRVVDLASPEPFCNCSLLDFARRISDVIIFTPLHCPILHLNNCSSIFLQPSQMPDLRGLVAHVLMEQDEHHWLSDIRRHQFWLQNNINSLFPASVRNVYKKRLRKFFKSFTRRKKRKVGGKLPKGGINVQIAKKAKDPKSYEKDAPAADSRLHVGNDIIVEDIAVKEDNKHKGNNEADFRHSYKIEESKTLHRQYKNNEMSPSGSNAFNIVFKDKSKHGKGDLKNKTSSGDTEYENQASQENKSQENATNENDEIVVGVSAKDRNKNSPEIVLERYIDDELTGADKNYITKFYKEKVGLDINDKVELVKIRDPKYKNHGINLIFVDKTAKKELNEIVPDYIINSFNEQESAPEAVSNPENFRNIQDQELDYKRQDEIAENIPDDLDLAQKVENSWKNLESGHSTIQGPYEDKNMQETPYIVQEKPFSDPEKAYIVPEKPYIISENPYIIPEKPSIVLEKPSIVLEKPYIAVKKRPDLMGVVKKNNHAVNDNSPQIVYVQKQHKTTRRKMLEDTEPEVINSQYNEDDATEGKTESSDYRNDNQGEPEELEDENEDGNEDTEQGEDETEDISDNKQVTQKYDTPSDIKYSAVLDALYNNSYSLENNEEVEENDEVKPSRSWENKLSEFWDAEVIEVLRRMENVKQYADSKDKEDLIPIAGSDKESWEPQDNPQMIFTESPFDIHYIKRSLLDGPVKPRRKRQSFEKTPGEMETSIVITQTDEGIDIDAVQHPPEEGSNAERLREPMRFDENPIETKILPVKVFYNNEEVKDKIRENMRLGQAISIKKEKPEKEYVVHIHKGKEKEKEDKGTQTIHIYKDKEKEDENLLEMELDKELKDNHAKVIHIYKEETKEKGLGDGKEKEVETIEEEEIIPIKAKSKDMAVNEGETAEVHANLGGQEDFDIKINAEYPPTVESEELLFALIVVLIVLLITCCFFLCCRRKASGPSKRQEKSCMESCMDCFGKDTQDEDSQALMRKDFYGVDLPRPGVNNAATMTTFDDIQWSPQPINNMGAVAQPYSMQPMAPYDAYSSSPEHRDFMNRLTAQRLSVSQPPVPEALDAKGPAPTQAIQGVPDVTPSTSVASTAEEDLHAEGDKKKKKKKKNKKGEKSDDSGSEGEGKDKGPKKGKKKKKSKDEGEKGKDEKDKTDKKEGEKKDDAKDKGDKAGENKDAKKEKGKKKGDTDDKKGERKKKLSPKKQDDTKKKNIFQILLSKFQKDDKKGGGKAMKKKEGGKKKGDSKKKRKGSRGGRNMNAGNAGMEFETSEEEEPLISGTKAPKISKSEASDSEMNFSAAGRGTALASSPTYNEHFKNQYTTSSSYLIPPQQPKTDTKRTVSFSENQFKRASEDVQAIKKKPYSKWSSGDFIFVKQMETLEGSKQIPLQAAWNSTDKSNGSQQLTRHWQKPVNYPPITDPTEVPKTAPKSHHSKIASSASEALETSKFESGKPVERKYSQSLANLARQSSIPAFTASHPMPHNHTTPSKKEPAKRRMSIKTKYGLVGAEFGGDVTKSELLEYNWKHGDH